MQIKRKIETTETVEVPAPSYWKSKYGGLLYYINAEGVLTMMSDRFVAMVEPSANQYAKEIDEAIAGEPITREEFDQKYSDVIGTFDRVVKELNTVSV